MSTTIQLRRGLAADIESVNPVPASGEAIFEIDTGLLKIGDGVTPYNDLSGISGGGSGGGKSIGDIFTTASTVPPIGSLECNGAELSRTEYADLFSVIGTVWGVGDGATTFNIPDLRGLHLVGTGVHGTATKADGSAYDGPAVGTIEDDQFQGHHHSEEYKIFSAVPGSVQTFEINGIKNQTADLPGFDVGDPVADGTNGPPRTGDETRPAAAGVLFCIQVSNQSATGTPLPTYSYSTGWVDVAGNIEDQDFTVTHGFGKPLEDLIIQVTLENDDGVFRPDTIAYDGDPTTDVLRGYGLVGIDNNSFSLNFGESIIFYEGGMARYLSNSDTTSRYKVDVYCPEVLATELAVTKYDSGWQAIPSAGNSATVTHNLGAARDDLIIEAQVRDAGGTNVSDFVDYFSNTTSDLFGEIIKPNDANSVIVQTLEGGPRGISGSGGSFVAAEYRLTIYNPNLLENVQPAPVKSLIDDYTITGRTDSPSFLVTTGATDRTVTLPSGNTMTPGDTIDVTKVDSGAGKVTISRAGSDTIEGATSVDLSSQWSKLFLRWTGNEWTLQDIVEQGSNSNGSYVVFSSGIQVCWYSASRTDISATSSYGSLYQGTRTLTYARAFASTPAVGIAGPHWGTSASWGSIGALPSPTSFVIRTIDVQPRAIGTATKVSYIAIGEAS